MAAAIYDITVEQGADFILGLQLKNGRGAAFDLTGVTAAGQLRANVVDDAALASFDITFDVNRKTGKLTLFIPASITTELNFVNGVYDLEFTSSSGMKKRVMQGKVTLSKEVTRVSVGP